MSKSGPTDFAKTPPRMTILSDHPILREDEQETSREQDAFTLHSRLGAVYDIIRHKNTRPPLAIAIYGDWGTGKSSAMRWLSDQLVEWSKLSNAKREKHCRARTVWFDPWKYTKREDVWRGLVAEVILKAIDVRGASLHTVVSAARQFGLFLGRSFLNVLSNAELTIGAKEAGGEAKIDLDALSKIAEDYRQTSHPEKAFLNEFETALREWVKASLAKDERMVIFIDDLDRCLPEVVLEVLEALKLYLNIPQLIFIVGLDREVVDAVVRHHYINNGLGEAKAKHYLDKMFQVEADIPPSQTLMEEYIQRQIKAMNDVTDGYWSNNLTGWNEDYEKIIEGKIAALAEDNPREVKRLLNSTLRRATAAALHHDLAGEEAQRFTQGCQVYLMQCILRKYVPKSSNLLRENETLDFLVRWSEFIEEQPDFRSRKDRGEHASDDQPQLNLPAIDQLRRRTVPAEPMGKRPPLSQVDEAAHKAYESLKASAPRYRDKEREPIPLLDQPDLWDLLVIPFSREVAAAAVIDLDQSRPDPDVHRDRDKGAVDLFEDMYPPQPEVSKPRRLRGPRGAAPRPAPRTTTGVGVGPEGEGEAPDPLASMTPTLLSAIARALKKPVDSLQPGDLWHVRRLNLNKADLSDLGPIQGLTNLQELYLSGTQVSDLGPIQGLTNLQSLHLDGTQVSDLGPIQGLINLRRLYLDKTQVSDLGPIQDLINLQRLHLDKTQVSDLEPIKGLDSLQILLLNGTQVSDLEPLKGLDKLQMLGLTETQVCDLGPIAGFGKLLALGLDTTQVSDLRPITRLDRLRVLNLRGTQVSDLKPIKEFTSLEALFLDGTQVSDLGPIMGLINLQRLDIDNTQVSDLGPITGFATLQQLHLKDTQVSDLGPLKGLTALQWLNLRDTQVSNLDPLSSLTNLEALYLTATPVGDLGPIKGLTGMKALDLDDTQVRDLRPIRALTKLRGLILARTQVSDLLPIKELTSLEALFLDGTPVSDLEPIQGLTNLQTLDLDNTQVSDLEPIKDLTNLTDLFLEGTPVSDAQVKALKKALPNLTIHRKPCEPAHGRSADQAS